MTYVDDCKQKHQGGKVPSAEFVKCVLLSAEREAEMQGRRNKAEPEYWIRWGTISLFELQTKHGAGGYFTRRQIRANMERPGIYRNPGIWCWWHGNTEVVQERKNGRNISYRITPEWYCSVGRALRALKWL